MWQTIVVIKMNYTEFKTTIDMGNSAPIELSTGKLAKQADGAVVLKQGATMLLATVVSAKEAKSGVDFLPFQLIIKRNMLLQDEFLEAFCVERLAYLITKY